jgi:hypothetical protein
MRSIPGTSSSVILWVIAVASQCLQYNLRAGKAPRREKTYQLFRRPGLQLSDINSMSALGKPRLELEERKRRDSRHTTGDTLMAKKGTTRRMKDKTRMVVKWVAQEYL